MAQYRRHQAVTKAQCGPEPHVVFLHLPTIILASTQAAPPSARAKNTLFTPRSEIRSILCIYLQEFGELERDMVSWIAMRRVQMVLSLAFLLLAVASAGRIVTIQDTFGASLQLAT